MAGTPYRAGGMQATVAATRAATEPELLTIARRHRAEMIAGGTTYMETKTGYGLTTHDELRAARTAKAAGFDEITFLGAHVVPPEFAKDPDAYLDLVCGPMLDAVAPQVGWIDVFCETGAFDEAQTRRVLAAGTRKGLGLRVHGNQLSTGPGVRIAVDTGAASVDHCTFLTDRRHRRVGRLHHGGHPAARLRPVHPPAAGSRSGPGRRRRPDRVGVQLQSRLVLHVFDESRCRTGRSALPTHHPGSRVRGDRRRRSGPAAHRRRNSILLTHHHGDHVQGVPGLKAKFPEARIVGPKKEAGRIPGLDVADCRRRCRQVGEIDLSILIPRDTRPATSHTIARARTCFLPAILYLRSAAGASSKRRWRRCIIR